LGGTEQIRQPAAPDSHAAVHVNLGGGGQSQAMGLQND
jgi:hypothetical protein